VNWRHPDYDGAEDRYEVVVRGGAKALTVGTLETAPGPGGPPRRVLATVLFTDIVGSTDRAREVGDSRWRELLDRHDAAARRLVEAHGGRLVKTTGDGILATFDRPGHGIGFARAFRGEVRELGIDIRAGLHTGEVEYRGDDVGGIAVHIASRIMDAAGPREILVSRTVRDLVAGSDVTAVGCPPVAVGAGALLGAGADACVVAGRLAQPARATVMTSIETITALQPRLTMIPPCALKARRGAMSSYHGSRGDHDGLVHSSGPRVIAVCSDPSTSIEKTCHAP